MDDTPGDLWRTVQVVGAVVVGFTLVAYQRCGAFRTFIGECYNGRITGTLPGINSNNLGDDLAALFNYNSVTIVKPPGVLSGHCYAAMRALRLSPQAARDEDWQRGDIPRSPHRKSTDSSSVTACSAAYLYAMAQQGDLAVLPRSRCASSELTFTTTPSVS